MNPASSPSETENVNMEKVGLFPPQGKHPDETTNPDRINSTKFNEDSGKPQVEQLVEEVNEDLNEGGSYQPPNSQKDNSRGRQRSPENLERKNRYRYDAVSYTHLTLPTILRV